MTAEARLVATIVVPPLDEDYGVYKDRESLGWDLADIGAVDERTVVILQSSVHGMGEKSIEHWMIDLDVQEVRGPVRYPDATPHDPTGIGGGRWLTAAGRLRYDVWGLV